MFFAKTWGWGVAAPSKKTGASLLLVVAARAQRDEVAKVEGCAAVRDGLDVVYLEPLSACAAIGAAVPVAAESGCACALPFRCGADDYRRVRVRRGVAVTAPARTSGMAPGGPRPQGRRWPRT